ncbi:MAG: phage tail protein, partial [Limnohabitans sp.]
GAWEQDRDQLTYYDPVPIGTVAAFLLGTAPAGWLLCDGSTYLQTAYPELFAVLGSVTLPDLRGEFLRGRAAGQTLGSRVDWTTGMPKTRFTATAANAGSHRHDLGELNQWHFAFGTNGANAAASAGGTSYAWNTGNAGDHTHAITVAGGDTETAPKHVLVDYYIKAAHAKVVLPAAGFQAQATALHDGDIWMYESASGVFKNVSGASLANGMTVGATAPAAPVDGQMWFRTTGAEPGLLVWAGGKWSMADGANTFTNGAKTLIPGYYNTDPSDTTAPVDVIGLAARYEGGKIELFARKGTAWDPIAPIAGDPSNAGKSVIANAQGNPVWTTNPIPLHAHLNTTGSQGIFVFEAAPIHYIKWEVSGESDTNTRLMLVALKDNAWWDWHTHVTFAQLMTSYEAGGAREEQAFIVSDYWTNENGGIITDDNSNYTIKAGVPWHSTGHLLTSANGAVLMADVSYTSDNNTPMRAIFRARWNVGMTNITQWGFKHTA